MHQSATKPLQQPDPSDAVGVRDRVAARDPLLWTGIAIFLLSLLPSLVHVLPADLTYTWADEYSDVPMLLMIVVTMALCRHAAAERRERVFWGLLMGSPLSMLAARLLYQLIPYDDGGVLSDQSTDLSYLLGYLCVVLALEFHPQRTGQATRARRVEGLGMLLYGFFLLSYFTLAPSIFRPELYATWVPSMLLYSVIDAYLLVRVRLLLRDGVDASWLAPLGWLSAVFLLWLVGDLAEGVLYMGVVPWIDPGTPADVLWALPGLLLFFVARSRSWEMRSTTADA